MHKEYKIHNDGYGYLTAEFPESYPVSHIEQDVTDTALKQKIDALLKTLTLDEKISMLSADGIMGQDTSAMSIDKSYGTGYWKGNARSGVPVMRCYDGPMGVIGNSGFETTRPSSEISVACTFDRELANRYGALYAKDNKASAGNMQLGIQTDLVRTLSTGRARDMFGEDWYLAGQMGSAMAKGLEDNHVLACLKHVGGMGNIDEQTMLENQLSIYEQIFRTDNTAHTVMTNYGSTNGQQACADQHILKDIFRNQWNWKGIVLTDWGGNYQFTTDKGVTMETPSDGYNNAEAVQKALATGTLTEKDIDEAVGNNLYAMGKIGYLGLVQISRDGTAAVDPTPGDAIEMDEITDEAHRNEILNQNSQAALEIAQAGMVLLKNENAALPLKQDEKTVLLGLGATHTVAGHMHECSFGRLQDLSVSPYDALRQNLNDVTAFPVHDDLGTPIPGAYLYTDSSLSANGVKRTGTDGNGVSVHCVDQNIDFVTNSSTYHNGPTGTAFPYGTQGAHFTFKTWLKAPESGMYQLKVEAIAATVIQAYIEINGEQKEIGSAGGRIGSGFFGTTGLVTSKTGLDIPTEPKPFPFNFPPVTAEGDDEGFAPPPMMPAFMLKKPGDISFQLEAGQVYPITVEVNGNIPEAYDYQIGKKDLQIRLAWVTPKQKAENYLKPMEAVARPNHTVVLFAHELEGLELEERQKIMLTDAIQKAKAAGNKVILVLTTALPVDISCWEQDCDAILAAWLPGQTGGTAIANILTGKFAPTGRLCVTWPRNFHRDQAELNTNGRNVLVRASHPSSNISTEIREGIFCGYKWYDSTGREKDVLYPFGHGLTYTTFDSTIETAVSAPAPGEDAGLDVTVRVKNTGSLPGCDVVQLYLKAPDSGVVPNAIFDPMAVAAGFHYVDAVGNPTEDMETANYFPQICGVQFAQKQLCGFAKTKELAPGEETRVTIHISQRSLSYWNAAQQDYTVRKDGSKDKWATIYGSRTVMLQNGYSYPALVTKLDESASLQVKAPELVSVGSVFAITVTAPSDTIGVQLLDGGAILMPIHNLTIERTEKLSRWIFHTVLHGTGTHKVSVQQKTWLGWQCPSAEISVRAENIQPDILSFGPIAEVVHSGECATFRIVTNCDDPVYLSTEAGDALTISEQSTTVHDNGNVEHILSVPCSRTGIGQIIIAQIGTSKARAAISVI